MIPRAITPEVLVLYKSGSDLVGIEIKSAATWNSTFQQSLKRFAESNAPLRQGVVVYNGRPLTSRRRH